MGNSSVCGFKRNGQYKVMPTHNDDCFTHLGTADNCKNDNIFFKVCRYVHDLSNSELHQMFEETPVSYLSIKEYETYYVIDLDNEFVYAKHKAKGCILPFDNLRSMTLKQIEKCIISLNKTHFLTNNEQELM